MTPLQHAAVWLLTLFLFWIAMTAFAHTIRRKRRERRRQAILRNRL